jgi:hypothetical protein
VQIDTSCFWQSGVALAGGSHDSLITRDPKIRRYIVDNV